MKQLALLSSDQMHADFTVNPLFADESRAKQEMRFNVYFRRDLIDVRRSIKQDFCLRGYIWACWQPFGFFELERG